MPSQLVTESLRDAVVSTSATVRRSLARHRWWRLVVVAAASAITVWSLFAAGRDAREARTDWGAQTEVWVAVADHAPGTPLRAEKLDVPAALVPERAVVSVDADAVAHQHLVSGEILVEPDVAPSGRFALAPAGSVVVPVADPLVQEAEPGTAVIVATEGVVLTDHGVVVDAVAGVVHVAVPARAAPAVAAAVASASASLIFPAPAR